MSITELPKPTLIQSTIALGGASCIFMVNFTHPIELVKTCIQVTGNGLGVVFNSALKMKELWGFGRESFGRGAVKDPMRVSSWVDMRPYEMRSERLERMVCKKQNKKRKKEINRSFWLLFLVSSLFSFPFISFN
jgi:hypothetical protein